MTEGKKNAWQILHENCAQRPTTQSIQHNRRKYVFSQEHGLQILCLQHSFHLQQLKITQNVAHTEEFMSVQQLLLFYLQYIANALQFWQGLSAVETCIPSGLFSKEFANSCY